MQPSASRLQPQLLAPTQIPVAVQNPAAHAARRASTPHVAAAILATPARPLITTRAAPIILVRPTTPAVPTTLVQRPTPALRITLAVRVRLAIRATLAVRTNTVVALKA